ncbi:hypothetical protein [Lysinibacillus sp. BPa_S21]|uniref:hypothetical protein n=2 Tax=unclassified Lysinibacillus TaxID=2636778 RepID=UPI0020112ACF|nr:hypothetical protein [Lysinibacillus sp. BPa_S21]MCL1702695.1 hypothetical protein [Lysinibacillus sp. Bpr_S20]
MLFKKNSSRVMGVGSSASPFGKGKIIEELSKMMGLQIKEIAAVLFDDLDEEKQMELYFSILPARES